MPKNKKRNYPRKFVPGTYSVKEANEPREREMGDQIKKLLPNLLAQLKIPFTLNDFQITPHYYPTYKLLEEAGVSQEGAMNVDFDLVEHVVQLKAHIASEEKFRLLFRDYNHIFLKALLTHELCHYFVTQSNSPELLMGFQAQGSPQIAEIAHNFQLEMLDFMKDQVTFAFMPPESLACFRYLKEIEFFLAWADNPSKVLESLNQGMQGTFVGWFDFRPIFSFPLLCSDLPRFAKGIAQEYSKVLNPTQLGKFQAGFTRLEDFYARIYRARAYPRDLKLVFIQIFTDFLELPGYRARGEVSYNFQNFPALLAGWEKWFA